MKKWLSAILMVSVLLIAGCSNDGGSVSTEKSTLQNVLNNKKLVIGTAPGYFPFDMKNSDGEFVGYDMDLANEIGEWLGVEVEFKQFVFDGLGPALQTGDVDMIIAGMTIRGDRALALSFSNPYYTIDQALMVSSDDTATKSWEDLDVKGNKVAVGIGTTGALMAKDIFKNAEVLDFEDFASAATAMKLGKANAVLYDAPAVAVWNLRNEGEVRKIDGFNSAEKLGIAVKKNDIETILWLNSFLENYIDSPKELESRKNWFETNDWLDKVIEE